VRAKGAPHDGKDTVKTLRAIIWYKRACIRQTTRRLSIAVPISKKCRYRTSSELENSILEINHVTNVTTVLNETAASGWASRSWMSVADESTVERRVRMKIHVHTCTCINVYIHTHASQ